MPKQTVIDTEATTPRPRRGRAVLAGIAVLALLAAGVAVATRGDGGPSKLALATDATAGAGTAGAQDESVGAPTAADATHGGAASSMIAPGWYGLDFEVDGTLPELGGRAPAWKAVALDFDRAAFAAFAAALGLGGDAVARDGGFLLENTDGTLSAFKSSEGWSVNFYRQIGVGAEPAPLGISAAEAERAARDVLDTVDALPGRWAARSFETETGYGYACASPADLRAVEAEKLADESAGAAEPAQDVIAPDGPGSDGPASSSPVAVTAPGSAAGCPQPPAPTKAWNVVFAPSLGDVSTDWAPWTVTVSGNGLIENLSGTLARFERAGEFERRGTAAALEELRAHSGAGVAVPMPLPVAVDDVAGIPAPPDAAVESGATSGGGSVGNAGGDTPTMVVAPEPDLGNLPAPMPPEPAEPQVVTINGVEPSLTAVPVWTDGEHTQLYLVPAYRFTGHLPGGDPWETTVIALHPDAIAPPPVSIMDGGREGGTADEPVVRPAVEPDVAPRPVAPAEAEPAAGN